MESSTDSLVEIQKQCEEDSIAWFPEAHANQDLSFLTIAFVGEVGEFANIIKKAMRGSVDLQDPETQYELVMEGIDAFIYLMLLFNRLNVNVAALYKQKREMNVE